MIAACARFESIKFRGYARPNIYDIKQYLRKGIEADVGTYLDKLQYLTPWRLTSTFKESRESTSQMDLRHSVGRPLHPYCYRAFSYAFLLDKKEEKARRTDASEGGVLIPEAKGLTGTQDDLLDHSHAAGPGAPAGRRHPSADNQEGSPLGEDQAHSGFGHRKSPQGDAAGCAACRPGLIDCLFVCLFVCLSVCLFVVIFSGRRATRRGSSGPGGSAAPLPTAGRCTPTKPCKSSTSTRPCWSTRKIPFAW